MTSDPTSPSSRTWQSACSERRRWLLVEIEKKFEGKRPVTYVTLTAEGKEALKEYWKRFDRVREGVKSLKPLRGAAG